MDNQINERPSPLIDSNIPLPSARGMGRRKYPFADLKLGQSFAVDIADRYRLNNSACGFKRAHPEYDFTVRDMKDGTARVWRVK